MNAVTHGSKTHPSTCPNGSASSLLAAIRRQIRIEDHSGPPGRAAQHQHPASMSLQRPLLAPPAPLFLIMLSSPHLPQALIWHRLS